MASKEELEAMGVIENANNTTANEITTQYPISFYIMCFLIPFIGFIGAIVHIDSNNKLAKKCLNLAWAGIITVVVLVVFILIAAEM